MKTLEDAAQALYQARDCRCSRNTVEDWCTSRKKTPDDFIVALSKGQLYRAVLGGGLFPDVICRIDQN